MFSLINTGLRQLLILHYVALLILPQEERYLVFFFTPRRCRIFRDEVYAALQSVKEKFLFHFIPADGTPDEVAARIRYARVLRGHGSVGTTFGCHV